MGKIIDLEILEKEIAKVRKSSGKIVLVGGCFDILHVGHIKFLKEAKKSGNFLIVLLESDNTVTRLKGKNRPHFPQKDRAEVLSSIKYVDLVILLTPMKNDKTYNGLIKKIKPSIIAITENDPILKKKEKQAKNVGGELTVIPYLKTHSSSSLADLLGVD